MAEITAKGFKNQGEKEINLLPIIGGIVLISVIVFVGWWFFFRPKSVSEIPPPPPAPEKGLTSRDAMSVAILKAKEWSVTASLLNFASQEGATGNREGKSNLWTFLFTSPEKRNLAYQIVVEDPGNVKEASEIAFKTKVVAPAITPDDLITQEEAIKKVRKISGYENVTVLGVEAEYGLLGKVWYWNVKTEKGNVSIHALRSENK